MNKKPQLKYLVLFSILLVGWGTLGAVIYTKIDNIMVAKAIEYLHEAKKASNETERLFKFELAALLDPSQESLLGAGVTALRLGDNDLAERYLSQVKTADGYYQLGVAQYNLENYPAAGAAYKKAIAKTPNDEYYLALAKAHLKLGELENAREALANIRSDKSDEADYLLSALVVSEAPKGYNALRKLGYPQAAEELLDTAGREGSLSRDGLLVLVQRQITAGEYEPAYSNLIKAKGIDAYYPQTYQQLIFVGEKLGKNEEAKQYRDFLHGVSL